MEQFSSIMLLHIILHFHRCWLLFNWRKLQSCISMFLFGPDVSPFEFCSVDSFNQFSKWKKLCDDWQPSWISDQCIFVSHNWFSQTIFKMGNVMWCLAVILRVPIHTILSKDAYNRHGDSQYIPQKWMSRTDLKMEKVMFCLS